MSQFKLYIQWLIKTTAGGRTRKSKRKAIVVELDEAEFESDEDVVYDDKDPNFDPKEIVDSGFNISNGDDDLF
jgi:hypothetical protein